MMLVGGELMPIFLLFSGLIAGGIVIVTLLGAGVVYANVHEDALLRAFLLMLIALVIVVIAGGIFQIWFAFSIGALGTVHG